MSQLETLPATSPPTLRGDTVDAILPELWKVGGPAGLFALTYWLFVTGRIVVGKVYDREVARGDKLEDIADNATKALEALSRKDDLAVALLRSVERTAAANEQAAGGGDEA